MVVKVRFIGNSAILHISKNSLEARIFSPKDLLGILQLMSVEYYELKHVVLQQTLSRYYNFESTEVLYENFNL